MTNRFRWCSSGMHDALQDGGAWMRSGGVRRWKCAACRARAKVAEKAIAKRERVVQRGVE